MKWSQGISFFGLFTVLAAFTLPLLSTPAWALKWDHRIGNLGAVPERAAEKRLIEFEIARSPAFSAQSLVDQGFSEQLRLQGELPPGLYYLRYRSQSQSKPLPWSSPVELLVGTHTQTQITEPRDQTRIESPSSETSFLFKWKVVPGASRYVLKLRNLATRQSLSKETQGPFANVEVFYGQWEASVEVYFGSKLMSTSSPLKVFIEPSIQDGAHFIKPQNGDIIPSHQKTALRLRRNYEPSSSTLVAKRVGQTAKGEGHEISKKISTRSETVYIPALAPGSYQLSIIDQLNDKHSVESNIQISVEDDPLQAKSRGFRGSAELLLGVLKGDHHQSNHYLSPRRAEDQAAMMGPQWLAVVRSAYFSPYHIDLRLEWLSAHFENLDTLGHSSTHSGQVSLWSADLLYETSLIEKPNLLFVRAGFFTKNYKQPFRDWEIGDSDSSDTETAIRIFGIGTGVDWLWSSWSTRWDARFSTRLLFPIFAKSQNIATGSIKPIPAWETSLNLYRHLTDYFYLSFGPQLKLERWKISETDPTAPPSEQYLVSWGLTAGLGLDW